MNDVLHVSPSSGQKLMHHILRAIPHHCAGLEPNLFLWPLLDHGPSVAADAVRVLLRQGGALVSQHNVSVSSSPCSGRRLATSSNKVAASTTSGRRLGRTHSRQAARCRARRVVAAGANSWSPRCVDKPGRGQMERPNPSHPSREPGPSKPELNHGM